MWGYYNLVFFFYILERSLSPILHYTYILVLSVDYIFLSNELHDVSIN